jgi:20S proteasome subunit alpha 1
VSRVEGFDRFLTVFSPEGHLYQLEYAFKSVNSQGLTSVGVRGDKCVAIATQKKIKDKLIDPSSVTNLFKISRRIACVTTGPLADCKALVIRAREEASDFEFQNGFPIPCSYLAKTMGDIAQSSTQHAGSRCLGVVMTLCEVDSELGPQLYRVDLAGSVFGYKACAAGTKEQEAQSLLEKRLKDRPSPGSPTGLTTDETCQMALDVLQTCVGADFKPGEVEIGLVEGPNSEFRVLRDDEVERLLAAIAERD